MPASPKSLSSATYVKGQYVANLIGVLIAALLLAAVVFNLFGDGRGEPATLQLFLALFVSCFAVIQPYTAIGNTRRDLLLGKWTADDVEVGEAESLVSPWRRLGWKTPGLGLATALVAALAVPVLGSGPFGLWTMGGMAALALFAVSTPLIGLVLPRDQRSFAAALSRVEAGAGAGVEPPATGSYFLFEHFGPWVLLQVVINVGIGVKQFSFESAKPEAIEAGGVPASVVASDFGIVFAIILFFVWLASAGQVRPDVRLGRVTRCRGMASRLVGQRWWVRALLVIGVLIAVTFVMQGLASAVLSLLGLEVLTVVAACSVKGLGAVGACASGCALGIWWGREQETLQLRELEASG